MAGFPADYQGPLWSCHWINIETVARRFYIQNGGIIAPNNEPNVNLATWVENNCENPSDAMSVVLGAIEIFCPDMPSPARIDYMYNDLFLRGMTAEDWTSEWNNYQNEGDDVEIKLIMRTFFADFFKAIEIQML